MSPQKIEVSKYALHDADVVDDEENKNIKFDDLLVDEGNTNMDVDGIFDDKENHPKKTLGLQPLVHEYLNDAWIVQGIDGSHMLSVDAVQTCVPKPYGLVIGTPTKRPSTKEKLMSLNMVSSAPMTDFGVSKEVLVNCTQQDVVKDAATQKRKDEQTHA